jgi:hypothetical protein
MTEIEHKIKITLENGFEEFETPVIKGKLNAVIISSFNDVSVTIESKMGYLIFHNAQHEGIKYYAPRAVLRAWKQFDYDIDTFDKFKLNEPLIIRVTGPVGVEVSIILRID